MELIEPEVQVVLAFHPEELDMFINYRPINPGDAEEFLEHVQDALSELRDEATA